MYILLYFARVLFCQIANQTLTSSYFGQVKFVLHSKSLYSRSFNFNTKADEINYNQ